jgi:3-methyladenine DNA glycosylase AlkD
MSSFSLLSAVIQKKANRRVAEVSRRFFKTGPGQYGEGDIFCGITVPTARKIAKQFGDLSHTEIEKALLSPLHEVRLIALLILVHQFEQGSSAEQRAVFHFYLSATSCINNWDLVDLSAYKIVGAYLLKHPKEKSILTKLARSNVMWERRIAIVATFAFIRAGKFADTFRLARLLMRDSHDLMHKAVGWMLREVGKRDVVALTTFLNTHISRLPRTTLRYAIERYPEPIRRAFLLKK